MRGVLLLLLIVAVALIAVLAFLSTVPSKKPSHPEPSVPVAHEDRKVQVFKPSYRNDELELKAETVQVPAGRTKLFAAVSALVRDERLFPKGVRLLGAEVKGRTAVLDFSEELRAGYSTDEEEALLKSLAATVGQFAEVREMRILVEGSPVEALGNVDLSEPVPVSPSTRR